MPPTAQSLHPATTFTFRGTTVPRIALACLLLNITTGWVVYALYLTLKSGAVPTWASVTYTDGLFGLIFGIIMVLMVVLFPRLVGKRLRLNAISMKLLLEYLSRTSYSPWNPGSLHQAVHDWLREQRHLRAAHPNDITNFVAIYLPLGRPMSTNESVNVARNLSGNFGQRSPAELDDLLGYYLEQQGADAEAAYNWADRFVDEHVLVTGEPVPSIEAIHSMLLCALPLGPESVGERGKLKRPAPPEPLPPGGVPHGDNTLIITSPREALVKRSSDGENAQKAAT